MEFQLIDISAQLSSDFKLAGAVTAANGMLIFALVVAGSVGVFDPDDESFQLIDIPAQLSCDVRFAGAAPTANGMIIVAPDLADFKFAGAALTASGLISSSLVLRG